MKLNVFTPISLVIMKLTSMNVMHGSYEAKLIQINLVVQKLSQWKDI